MTFNGAPEGEAGEVVGIRLNQVFGNRIEFCHARCALGERVWLRVSKIRDHG